MGEPRPGPARRSPGREAGSRGVTLSRSLCTPRTSGHPVRATLVQPGTGVSPAPRKGAAGERPACAPCQLPGRQRQRARPSEDARRGPAVAITVAAGPGRWPPARRGSGRGGHKHQRPRPAPAPGVTTQVPLWGWRHDGTSTQGWWHHCPPHGCLWAGGCRRAGQVTCLVSENTSRTCGGHRDQLPPPAPAATELPAPGPRVCLPSPRPLGAGARLSGSVGLRPGIPSVRQAMGSQVSAQPRGTATGRLGPVPATRGLPARGAGCDTLCWEGPPRPRAGLRLWFPPQSHGNGRGQTALGPLECQLQSRPADINIRNFLRIPRESCKARRRSA